jgi:hypothetical protein
MKIALTIIARLSLVFTVLPSFLYLFGFLSLEAVKWIMAVAAVSWFISAPLLQREYNKATAH